MVGAKRRTGHASSVEDGVLSGCGYGLSRQLAPLAKGGRAPSLWGAFFWVARPNPAGAGPRRLPRPTASPRRTCATSRRPRSPPPPIDIGVMVAGRRAEQTRAMSTAPPLGRGRHSRAGAGGKGRRARRTSRKARASHRDRNRRDAASRALRPRPSGWREFPHARSDRCGRRSCDCRRARGSTPSRAIAAPTENFAAGRTAARASSKAALIGSALLLSAIKSRFPCGPSFGCHKRFSFGGPRRSGLGQAAAGGNA